VKPGFSAALQEYPDSRVKRLAVKLLEHAMSKAVEQVAVRRYTSLTSGWYGRFEKPEAD